MQRKITLLAIDENISMFFKKECQKIFSDLFQIDYRSADIQEPLPITNTDLILYTDPTILNKLIHLIQCPAPTLMMKRTIRRESLEKIKELPAGSIALVANINEYMANETAATIHQLGIKNIRLIPVHKDSSFFEKYDYIITPRRYMFLPDAGDKIIIIGNRVFDISMVLDVLSIMQVDNNVSEEIMFNYLSKVPTIWHGIGYAWENRRVLVNRWNILINEIAAGVIVCDEKGNVELANQKAAEILSTPSDLLHKHDIDYISWKEPELGKILKLNEAKDELTTCSSGEVVVSVKSIHLGGEEYGKLIVLNQYHEMINTQQKAQKKLTSQGYVSKYSFEDLVGKSGEFEKAKNICKKVSLSDSTVLLFGESGVGKEMFAGAIHNNSGRKNKPFIAINCATLPENLLESELFGYEEGAFTGARKGGRVGLFELAHSGTIFLDEIGDLPLSLQARLLRAIEEKEIRRVGGENMVSVNVRIIAATNKNLPEMVKLGEFRNDLYYRLNVFQVSIPPLRKRKIDIPLLINHFINDRKLKISREFIDFCNNYEWPGNIRELRNVLEYAATISDGEINISSLPDYIKDSDGYCFSEDLNVYLMLKIVYDNTQQKRNTGRRTLKEEFSRKFVKISEAKARDYIQKLKSKNLVSVNSGRKGVSITEKGVSFLQTNGYI